MSNRTWEELNIRAIEYTGNLACGRLNIRVTEIVGN